MEKVLNVLEIRDSMKWKIRIIYMKKEHISSFLGNTL